VRDLLRHVGTVHRWAAAHVRDARTDPIDNDELAVIAAVPDDDDLLAWFCDGHRDLVATLASAPPDVECWAFLPADSPLAFWARRQAHETAIHRVDAASADGDSARRVAFPAAFAADGLDELLTGFVARPTGRLRSDAPRSMQIHCTDTPGDWLATIGADRVNVERASGPADVTLTGRAEDLYLFLWNRTDGDAVDTSGDASLLDAWRSSVTIRWS
jgi:uncharacterized protein (TIGR03083 family)